MVDHFTRSKRTPEYTLHNHAMQADAAWRALWVDARCISVNNEPPKRGEIGIGIIDESGLARATEEDYRHIRHSYVLPALYHELPYFTAKGERMADDQPLTPQERTLPPHLGGHFGNSNVDTATLDELIRRYGVRSMLDVGCGPGGQLQAATARGLDAWGIDGDPFMDGPRVTIHDYTTGPFVPPRTFDLVWSMEFVEHVEAQYIPNFLATFAVGRVLFLTAAPPGFPGWHHVNCQPATYWVDLLRSNGWALDEDATVWVRQHGGHVFSVRQGLVFVKSS